MQQKPTIVNGKGKTAEQKARFLAEVRQNGCDIAAAAAAVGVDRSTPYRWKQHDMRFALELEQVRRAQLLADIERSRAAYQQRIARRLQRAQELLAGRQQQAANARAAKKRG